jgi:predicted adenine nucleotide alpha hydrolase (AANH) superfamily ATPase
MIKLKNLVPENKHDNISNLDEKRKFPHLNPKMSIADSVLKFAERDDTFISFRSLLKAGLNPSTEFDTPIGIYMYPAKMALKYYGKSDKFGIKFPFAIGERFIHFVIKKPNIKELNIDTYTKQDGERDMDKLIKIYSSMFDENTLNELKTSGNIHTDVEVGQFWHFCYKLSEMLTRPKGGKSSTHWNNILKKDLGYDLVIDPGSGVIHTGEPCQAFFTNQNVFTPYAVMEQSDKVINYNKIGNSQDILKKFFKGRRISDQDVFSLLSKSSFPTKVVNALLSINVPLTDKNVANFIIYSTNKQETIDALLNKGISIDKILTDETVRNLFGYSTNQEMVDVLLSKNVPLTDKNVATLFRYSSNKQELIDALLNKGISIDKLFTDKNVENFIISSSDKQETIDVLLSKNVNVPLTDKNVVNLIVHSSNYQKTIDVLLSKNVPLTDENVDILIYYSSNKLELIDALLNKGISIDKLFTDKNVNNLIIYSSDKQEMIDVLLSKNVPLTDENVANLIVHSSNYQKMIDVLLSKNVPLTDENVKNLVHYSSDTDRQKTIDALLNKGISIDKLFTDKNVKYLLMYSTNQQETIDVLLSKNVPLTDENVKNLFRYSSDQQEMIDVLLSKNVPLTDKNVETLFRYSTDREKTARKIDALRKSQKYKFPGTRASRRQQRNVDALKATPLHETKIKYRDFYIF